MSTLFEAAGMDEGAGPRPLADRLRPKSLKDVIGQDHILGPEAPVERMLAAKRLSSIILWGPPGTGKTTIARLLSQGLNLHFEQISAIFSGVAELRKVFDMARARRTSAGRTHTLATLYSAARRQPSSTNASSSSGRSSEWSMVLAMSRSVKVSMLRVMPLT